METQNWFWVGARPPRVVGKLFWRLMTDGQCITGNPRSKVGVGLGRLQVHLSHTREFGKSERNAREDFEPRDASIFFVRLVHVVEGVRQCRVYENPCWLTVRMVCHIVSSALWHFCTCVLLVSGSCSFRSWSSPQVCRPECSGLETQTGEPKTC